MRLFRAIDYPPVWLAGFLAVSWAVGRVFPLPGLPVTGLVLAGVGLALMLAAAGQMVLARTTFVPRRVPGAMVSRGLFAMTRNPIYLGDALILAGMSLFWNGLLALPLVAVFAHVIRKRFIEGEETVLRQRFGPDFDAYCARVRRWI